LPGGHKLLAGLTSKNISYFINPDASEANPQAVMLGDDNLQVRGLRVKPGLLELASNTPVTWTPGRHGLSGNLAMADGSAQSATASGLKAYLNNSTNTAPTRLAIP
jgi:prepilin-type processing-associated H-X9-DG protein